AGSAQADPDGPRVGPKTIAERHVAHIYYNLATDERIATLIDPGVRPADNGVSPAVWITGNSFPCGSDTGGAGGTSGIIDSPDGTTCFGSTCTGQIFLDWGDIPTDQVIDCVGITWSTQIIDEDTDGDGLGDGVPGFGATWAWFDAENGFDSSATRLDLAGFTFFSLPGFTGTFDPNLVAVYTATVDLAASFTSSLAFEIGDTDSVDGSGTGQFNAGSGDDLDGDGLADFGYALQFIQPGTFDFDGDGALDGDPSAAGITAWSLSLPDGDAIDNGDGSWSFVPDQPPAGQGVEDAFDVFIDVDNDGVLEPLGTFFYGGFSCDTNGDGVIGDVTPFAQFSIQMFGPGGDGVCCPADVFPDNGPGNCGDGVLNFFDVSTFITWFNEQDPRADIFPEGGDGQFNFFDISTFVGLVNAGCP
ncbi:MAG: GC-type dockerin domain-anchored protein, partial [Planctomycetota bacterium]